MVFKQINYNSINAGYQAFGSFCHKSKEWEELLKEKLVKKYQFLFVNMEEDQNDVKVYKCPAQIII